MRHYVLVDVNPYYYQCGHYPEWIVEPREGLLPVVVPRTKRGTPLAYAEQADAESAAEKLNRASLDAWHYFLNG